MVMLPFCVVVALVAAATSCAGRGCEERDPCRAEMEIRDVRREVVLDEVAEEEVEEGDATKSKEKWEGLARPWVEEGTTTVVVLPATTGVGCVLLLLHATTRADAGAEGACACGCACVGAWAAGLGLPRPDVEAAAMWCAGRGCCELLLLVLLVVGCAE